MEIYSYIKGETMSNGVVSINFTIGFGNNLFQYRASTRDDKRKTIKPHRKYVIVIIQKYICNYNCILVKKKCKYVNIQ